MRRTGKILQTAILAIASTAPASATIPNGDFELEENGGLAGWLPEDTINYSIPNNVHGTGNGYTDYIWDTQSAGGGEGSLLIKGRGTRVPSQEKRVSDATDRVLSTKVAVKGDTEYRLTFKYRSQGLSPSGGQRCIGQVSVFFGGGSEFQPGFMSHIGYIRDRWNANEKIPGRPFDPVTKPGYVTFDITENSADWKTVEFSFKTPPDATKADIRPSVFCTMVSHPFGLWFDDISLEPAAGNAEAMKAPETWSTRKLPPTTDRGLHTGEPELLPPAIPYGSRLQRTMKLLATSTPERRNKVRILCYGQSIIAQPWWSKIHADLKQKYPNADIIMENTSLGGFMSDTLRISAETDLYPIWPDLVIMHDYEPNGDFGRGCTEQIYATLKDRTTSEMLTYTYHNAFPGTYSSPGIFSVYQRGHGAGSESVRILANKYNYEVAEARNNWEKVTKELFPNLDFRFAINYWLWEQIHTHPRGQRFYHYLAMPHFVYRPDAPPTWLDTIRVYSPDGSRWPQTGDEYPSGGIKVEKPLKFEFTGTRIDVIAMPVDGHPGSAKILIDGKPPTSHAGVFACTRAVAPKAKIGWPLILRAGIGEKPIEQEWTLTFTKGEWENNDSNKPYFEYDLTGSVTGPEGKGNNRERFVSKSGQIVLEPEYFLSSKFTGPAKFKHEPGIKVKWKTTPIALDTWKQRTGVNAAEEDRYVLAQGLSNEKHTLEILPTGDGAIGLRAFVVYQPPKIELPPAPVAPAAAAPARENAPEKEN